MTAEIEPVNFVWFSVILQPIICLNATCHNRTNWALLRQESKFTDWQRVRMQETSSEIPAGSLPRSLDVILRHDIVEQARAGDTYGLLILFSHSIFQYMVFSSLIHVLFIMLQGCIYRHSSCFT